MKANPFDTPEAMRFNEARRTFLEALLVNVGEKYGIGSALDVGCGVGLFCKYLKARGMKVKGLDARTENVDEAKRRNPGVEFDVSNIESLVGGAVGQFDLVVCFGLLYHLENPFLAIRNLFSVTGKLLLVETVIAPWKPLAAFLYEEDQRPDQGVHYVALIPTESFLIKCFYTAGFSFVYKPGILPKHEYFRSSLIKRRRRTFLVASKIELSLTGFDVAREPKTDRHMWDSLIVGAILKAEHVRGVLRHGLSGLNDWRNRRLGNGADSRW